MSHEKIKLWDAVVRTAHWSIAFVFFANYYVNEAGESWHEYLGYYACFWLAIRFFWGFVGPSSARWKDFQLSLTAVSEHLTSMLSRRVYNRLGHTPLGSIVMICMLVLVGSLGITGFMMEEVDEFWGEDWLMDLHRYFANALAVLVFLHLIAGIFQSIKIKENLLFSMFTGNRKKLSK